jgi:hypothetical protein
VYGNAFIRYHNCLGGIKGKMPLDREDITTLQSAATFPRDGHPFTFLIGKQGFKMVADRALAFSPDALADLEQINPLTLNETVSPSMSEGAYVLARGHGGFYLPSLIEKLAVDPDTKELVRSKLNELCSSEELSTTNDKLLPSVATTIAKTDETLTSKATKWTLFNVLSCTSIVAAIIGFCMFFKNRI